METLWGDPVVRSSRVASRAHDAVALIIDEDAATRALLRLHLASSGYLVLEARDAVQGAYLALSATPDLIICDVRASRLDDFDFLSALKSAPDRQHVFVVYLVEADCDERVQEPGSPAVLRKPVDPKRLRAVIEASKRALR